MSDREDEETEIAAKKLKDTGLLEQSTVDIKENMILEQNSALPNHEKVATVGEAIVNGHEKSSSNAKSNKSNETNISENKSSSAEDAFAKNGFNLYKEQQQGSDAVDLEPAKDKESSSTTEETSNICASGSESNKNSCDNADQIGTSDSTKASVSDNVENCSKRIASQNETEKDGSDAGSVDKENDSDVIIIGTSESFEKCPTSGSDELCKTQYKNQVGIKTGSEASSSTPSTGDASMTVFARLLHDLGVELVRQHVYKDLVDIQLSKESQNKLSEREKEQLTKLEEFHSKQETRNAPYSLKPYVTRCKCRVFATDSVNVMRLHQEYGRIEGGTNHVCCCCREFRTRWPSHFISHMKMDHGMLGRLRKKMSPYKCSFCSYEAKNQLKIDTHMMTCSKRFVLACNLQPLPADTDIPLKRKFIQPGTYNSQQRYSNYLANTASSYTPNYHLGSQSSYYAQSSILPSRTNDTVHASMSRGSPMYSNMQQNVTGNNGSNFSQQQQQMIKDGRTNIKHSTAVELCEICGVSMGNRAILLNHLQIQHKVKLNTSRGSTEPTMSCDRCPSRFWTYQGLAKHATVVHRINTGSSSSSISGTSLLHGATGRTPPICHICGDSQTLNPLNHMSTRHNITLLDMFYAKQCYICNKSLKNGPAFQDHMVLYHRDIFANKDVLHTVLQALSAARHLKREESLQQQHQASSSNFSRYKKPVTSQQMNVVQASTVNSRPIINRKRSSQQGAQTATASTKTPDKKSQEQDRVELEKLYENLAGIGRPILRSMRQKMSTGTLPSTLTPNSKATFAPSPGFAATDSNISTGVANKVDVETTRFSNNPDEPSHKKAKVSEAGNKTLTSSQS